MKKNVEKFFQHPLITGSSFIFLGTLFGNVFNFLFTAFMLRYLPAGDKGSLFALVSLITLPFLAANAAGPAIVSFAGAYFAKNETAKVHALYSKVARAYLFFGIVFFLIFFLCIPALSEFLKIQNRQLLILTNVVIFIGFFNVINTAFLQAKLAFKYIAFLNILSAILKFVLGLAFVLLGFAVGGAMTAIVVAAFIPVLLSFVPLKFVFTKNIEQTKVNMKEILMYGLPSAVTVLGLTSFITSDILLVKHFFESSQADFYAGISIIGRVIFYFSSPIGVVMFPLVVQRMTKKEKYTGIFLLSMLLVFLPSFVITLCYFLFPELIMNVFGIQNLLPEHKGILGMFGGFVSIYALVSVLVSFYLSIKKTGIYIPVIIMAAVQIFGIWFYHRDLLTVVTISLASSFLLLLVLLLYYPYATKEK